ARLLDIPPRELKSLNRIDLARDMAAKWGVILLLKGAYTVIASPDGKTYVLPFANPLLATAGSGDVLAGIIASLMGQGVSPLKGTVVAGYLHGLAGEVAAQSFGDRGLLASELIDYLPEAIKRLNSHAVPS
ncbi:MAG: ADP/ATP-dependent (S)-NAD(P)H-hydrate dehydratase, partial [Chloroflexota bacterium]